MPKPRKQLISLNSTPYYHCTSRCVRRAFLCGFDQFSNKNYEHRREWIENRIHYLASVFSIDVCAYAVMSNHTHLVLYINQTKNVEWSDEEVASRWHKLYKGTPLSRRYVNNDHLTDGEIITIKSSLKLWRARLRDISWFMRALNEPIARQANTEDGCTGKFWESRFKSQALLDEKALIACLAYVDLNPIRANISPTPEVSEHTSIKLRCETFRKSAIQPSSLMPFVGNPREQMPHGLPFHVKDYIHLIDWTGQIVRRGKRGYIDPTTPPILKRLAISPETWLILSTQFESRFKSLVGVKEKLRAAANILGFKRTPGLANCKALLS